MSPHHAGPALIGGTSCRRLLTADAVRARQV
jgi:hypothetical protein